MDIAVQQQQTEPTLKELLSVVQTTNFFGLGLQLNIKEYDLNVIEKGTCSTCTSIFEYTCSP